MAMNQDRHSRPTPEPPKITDPIAEFRVRDAMLIGYCLTLVTGNWLLLASGGQDISCAMSFLIGGFSLMIVWALQAAAHPEYKFNRLCFGAFCLLTLAVIAADVTIAAL